MIFGKRKRRIEELEKMIDLKEDQLQVAISRGDAFEAEAVKLKGHVISAANQLNELNKKAESREKTINKQSNTIKSMSVRNDILEARLSIR